MDANSVLPLVTLFVICLLIFLLSLSNLVDAAPFRGGARGAAAPGAKILGAPKI